MIMVLYLHKGHIMTYLFTSESVSEGHPDKLCDQISDAILDEALSQDPNSRVAAETFAASQLILVGGEITSSAQLDFKSIVKNVVDEVGYTDPSFGLDANHCTILSSINKQSPDIAQGVNKGEGLHTDLGAGDQGIMFGYACNHTQTLMPLPIFLAHKLVRELAQLRKTNHISYLRPDSKAQVSVEFEGQIPKRIDTIVVSTQHAPDVSHDQIRNDIINLLIRPNIDATLLDSNTKFLINPTGRFVTGGPEGDAGLTGRKIIVDTYGGWASHGGGAFSGKDATKVDRSATYMARYIAKNIVAAKIADQIQVQLAYAIGVAEPVSIHLETRGSAKIEESKIESLIRDSFDLTPEGIIKSLDLRKPIFRKTAAYGHFGRDDIEFTWEKCDKVEELKSKLSKKFVCV